MESCGLKDEDVERLVLEWKSSRAEKIYTWRTTTLATRVYVAKKNKHDIETLRGLDSEIVYSVGLGQ